MFFCDGRSLSPTRGRSGVKDPFFKEDPCGEEFTECCLSRYNLCPHTHTRVRTRERSDGSFRDSKCLLDGARSTTCPGKYSSLRTLECY